MARGEYLWDNLAAQAHAALVGRALRYRDLTATELCACASRGVANSRWNMKSEPVWKVLVPARRPS